MRVRSYGRGMTRSGQRGQAAIEGIGITVVVALLMAATAAWLAGAAGSPARPPDVVGRVAEPLGDGLGQRILTRPALPPFLSATGDGAAPIGRALAAAGRGVVSAAIVYARARNQYAVGFGERLRERVGEIIRDPLGDPGDLPDADMFTLRGLGLEAARRAGDLWDYARFLRSLPPEQAVMRAARDAGRESADAAIEVAQGALRRRLTRGGRGAPPAPREPQPPRGP
jgi:hypothetical protein